MKQIEGISKIFVKFISEFLALVNMHINITLLHNEIHKYINSITFFFSKFELLLRTYDGDDPLQPWFEYIEWVEQTYIKHGREGNLLPLLENCLAQFKDDFKYNQDVRYVKLWIKYVSTLPYWLVKCLNVILYSVYTLCVLYFSD